MAKVDITNLKYFFNDVIPELEDHKVKLIVTFVYPRDNYLRYDFSIIGQECVFAEMKGKVVEFYLNDGDYARITAEIYTTIPDDLHSIRSIKTYFLELKYIKSVSFPDWYERYIAPIFADELIPATIAPNIGYIPTGPRITLHADGEATW